MMVRWSGEVQVNVSGMSGEEGYPRTPDSSEGLIPRVIICYMGIDPLGLVS